MGGASDEELIDVVDGDDRVLRQATRAEVRAANLWHRACYVVVIDDRERVFVHLRTASKDVFPSHFDVMIGGVVAAGEAYAAAARREVVEEIGVVPRDLRRVGRLRYEDDTNRVIGEIFECRATTPLRLQREEIVSGEWVEPAEVMARAQRQPFCPDGLRAFETWLATAVAR